MVKEFFTQFNIFWATPTPDAPPIVAISAGWKFLLYFTLFFVIVKLNDPLEEILHIFKIGSAILCGCLVTGAIESLYLKIRHRRLINTFGQMLMGFLAVYSLAVGMVYLLERALEGAVREGWIWKYYWRHLPFAILTIGFYLYWAYKTAVVDRLISQINSGLESPDEAAMPAEASDTVEPPMHFTVGGVTWRLMPEEIVAASVNGHYVEIHYLRNDAPAYLSVRKPLGELMTELPGDRFVKIHRSHIVNLGFIRQVKKRGRQYRIRIDHLDAPLPISRNNLPQVLARIEQTL